MTRKTRCYIYYGIRMDLNDEQFEQKRTPNKLFCAKFENQHDF